MKKFVFFSTLWFSSLISIFVFLAIFSFTYKKDKQVLGASINLTDNPTEIYSSIPPAEPQMESKVVFADARAQIIKNYLEKFKAPLELQSEVDFLVQKSDEANVNPKLVVAIARKESSLCKNIASLENGSTSNNCGGLGIFGKTMTSFSSIHDWIEAEINFLNKAYISKGVTDTCEIEKTHTPPAKGVWCHAVNTYISEME